MDFFGKKCILIIMELIAENFQTEGLGNGFPFLLKGKEDWMRLGPLTDGLFPGQPLAVNHYWNLGRVNFDAKIKTEIRPEGYENSYFNTSQDADINGFNDFSVSYRVYNPYDETDLKPIHRIAPDVTGSEYNVNLNNKYKIVGEGKDKTSCYLAKENNGYMGFYQHLTIQPKNTGVFVITLDEEVARYFENIDGFGQRESFEIQHKINVGSGVIGYSPEGTRMQVNDNIYVDFPISGYLVPREGWGFKLRDSKITNHYYQYG